MPTCHGCNVTFPTPVGLAVHFRRTTNPRCAELRQQALAYLPPLNEPSSGNESSEVPAVDGLQPTAFTGDFFGADYTEEDFGMLDEASVTVMPLDSDDESNSDSSDDGFNQGNRWEPPPSFRSPSPTNQIIDSDDEDVPLRPNLEERFLQRPTVVTFQDTYPGSLAGMPIPTTPASKSGYLGYKAQLGTDGETNIWAPFKSQLDWEVAKWAKLRGPSSTAFTELLKLEGVHGCSICRIETQ
ncbi:hypothetical protein BD779DRAFT_1474853 [Infundibulicybe gibba]|nr:hypothetical protein BD779DRAFT_1474853 [Infundibulicybe gibba]